LGFKIAYKYILFSLLIWDKNVNKFAYICGVLKQFEKYKGIHPGVVLARELKKRSIKQRPFALSIAAHPQTFNAITKGKRSINTSLALKIERELNMEEGTLLILQVFYDIQQEKMKLKDNPPETSKFRKALFWDTDFDKIDWEKQYKAIINRVYEKGNAQEKMELSRFYGKAKIAAALKMPKTKPMTISQLSNMKNASL